MGDAKKTRNHAVVAGVLPERVVDVVCEVPNVRLSHCLSLRKKSAYTLMLLATCSILLTLVAATHSYCFQLVSLLLLMLEYYIVLALVKERMTIDKRR